MKRTLIPLLLVAPVVLAGCQTIKSHNPFGHKEPAYKSAQQEQPLEVPPGMDQPPTTEALAIPEVGNGAPSTAVAPPGTGAPSTAVAPPGTGAPSTAVAPPGTGAPPAVQEGVSGGVTSSGKSLTIPDTPDSVYHRVGLALARGDAGQVTASDAAAHTYQVAVDTVVTQKPQGGFFHNMFHHSKSETVKGTVTVSVAPSGTGSVVTASGDAGAAAHVMGILQQRLGGS